MLCDSLSLFVVDSVAFLLPSATLEDVSKFMCRIAFTLKHTTYMHPSRPSSVPVRDRAGVCVVWKRKTKMGKGQNVHTENLHCSTILSLPWELF